MERHPKTHYNRTQLWGNAPQLFKIIWNIILEAQRITIMYFLNVIYVIERHNCHRLYTVYTPYILYKPAVLWVYRGAWRRTVVFFGGEKTDRTFFWKPGFGKKVPSVFHAPSSLDRRLASPSRSLVDPSGAPWRPENSGKFPKIRRGAPIDHCLAGGCDKCPPKLRRVNRI